MMMMMMMMMMLDDDWCGAFGGIIWQGKQKYLEKTCLGAALATTNPT
jgi:hypothetical protein